MSQSKVQVPSRPPVVLVLLLVLVLDFIVAPSAQAQEPKVRASMESKDDVFVGQRATLVIELLAPGYFASAASFDLPDPPGVLLSPPVGSPTLGTEDVDGTTYTVQRHELSVFPRRGGAQSIPPITVRFRYKHQPLDKTDVAAAVKTETIPFTVKVPPGAEKLGGVLSARDLTAVESWSPTEPTKAKAGDAFTRTVTFAAPDIPAMAFPPFPAAKIDGVGVYPKPPDVLDRSERGTLQGERRDVAVYVFQRPGTFVLPAARLTWFDLDAQKLQTIDFPARTVEIAPNPAMAASPPGAGPKSTTDSRRFSAPSPRTVVITIALFAAAVAAAFVVRRRWARWVAPFRPVHLAPLNPTSQETAR